MPNSDKDQESWRWDDLNSVFDEDFVANAEFKEGDWEERRRAAKEREREAKKEARPGRSRRATAQPAVTKEPLSTSARLKRLAVVLGLIVVLAIGLGADGFGPFRFLHKDEPPAPTTTTVAPSTTASSAATSQPASSPSSVGQPSTTVTSGADASTTLPAVPSTTAPG